MVYGVSESSPQYIVVDWKFRAVFASRFTKVSDFPDARGNCGVAWHPWKLRDSMAEPVDVPVDKS